MMPGMPSISASASSSASTGPFKGGAYEAGFSTGSGLRGQQISFGGSNAYSDTGWLKWVLIGAGVLAALYLWRKGGR